VLQNVAVCCSVLQCVAVCCRVLQCVAVCFSVLQCVAVNERHGVNHIRCHSRWRRHFLSVCGCVWMKENERENNHLNYMGVCVYVYVRECECR